MTYATIEDIQNRIGRELSETEITKATTLMEDAAVIIDSYNSEAPADAKKVVTCRMVVKAIGDGTVQDVPLGATQGSVSALGYSQSWSIGGGGYGDLYLSKLDKKLLGIGNRIGSYSPVEELAE